MQLPGGWTPGSPDFHHWMTPDEVAASNVQTGEAVSLVSTLAATGLAVPVGDGQETILA